MNSKNRLQVFKRAAVSGTVYIHDEMDLYQAPILNLSAGGVFLSKLTQIESETIVRVVIKAKGLTSPIQATGRVVRVERGNGLAVEFTSISRQARAELQNCVTANRMTDLKVA